MSLFVQKPSKEKKSTEEQEIKREQKRINNGRNRWRTHQISANSKEVALFGGIKNIDVYITDYLENLEKKPIIVYDIYDVKGNKEVIENESNFIRQYKRCRKKG